MFLVVFRNRKRADYDAAAYKADATAMLDLARQQPGFLSFKSYTADDGEVVALSEWQDEPAARAWGQQADHLLVQKRGRAAYYQSYSVFACASPRVYHFPR